MCEQCVHLKDRDIPERILKLSKEECATLERGRQQWDHLLGDFEDIVHVTNKFLDAETQLIALDEQQGIYGLESAYMRARVDRWKEKHKRGMGKVDSSRSP
jgi:hypothetical protein